MTQPAIRVEGLWKEYLIGGRSRAGGTFRESIIASLARPFRRAREQAASDARENRFWALNDVSFEIQPGEVVGIIGRNGAGKSTLLKVLSRITAPTKGRVEIRGRVASLLEVGTGFHPELTGRENIRLNAAILGMSGAEIAGKFDEIVDFSGVEKFIETPVKRYSSGMQMRLAFAVAAHLDPEILVIDEVLAVGDAEFQRKCLGKMREITATGERTVVFVSHNMTAVQALCPRSILLGSGQIVAEGTTGDVLEIYHRMSRSSNDDLGQIQIAIGERLILSKARVEPNILTSGEMLRVDISMTALKSGRVRDFSVLIYSLKGTRVAICDLRLDGLVPFEFSGASFSISVKLGGVRLIEGDYTVGLYIATDDFIGNILELDEFHVKEIIYNSDIVKYTPDVRGICEFNFKAQIYESSISV